MSANPPPTTAMTKAGNGQILPFKQKVEDVRAQLTKMQPQLRMAMPKHMDPARMIRVVITTLQRTPKLLDCTRESLLLCILQAAQLGLEPDGLLGHAYLLPYEDRKNRRTICQLIVGYKGMLKLARNSNEIASIEAHTVRVGDFFRYGFGTKSFLKHRPAEPPMVKLDDETMGPDPKWLPGPMTHVYAVARMRDGTRQFEVMQTYEVNWIRDESPGYQTAKRYNNDTSPWIAHYGEMAKKTVLRRLCKMLPASIELQKAVTLDEFADSGISQDLGEMIDVSAAPTEEQQPAEETGEGLADASEADESSTSPTPAAPAGEPTKLDKLAESARAGRKGGQG